jgi:putative N-acetylmannosamine-6-phosphate epimerase
MHRRNRDLKIGAPDAKLVEEISKNTKKGLRFVAITITEHQCKPNSAASLSEICSCQRRADLALMADHAWLKSGERAKN